MFLFKPFICVQYCQTPHLFAANTRGQAKNSPVFYAFMSPSGILGTLAIEIFKITSPEFLLYSVYRLDIHIFQQ